MSNNNWEIRQQFDESRFDEQSEEGFGPEDVEDFGRGNGSYDFNHAADHVDHRRQSVATIFTITKEELRQVPSLVNHEAHKVLSFVHRSTLKGLSTTRT